MADSAWMVFTSESAECSVSVFCNSVAFSAGRLLTKLLQSQGNFFIDDVVLASRGVTDLRPYNVDPDLPQHELVPDFFV